MDLITNDLADIKLQEAAKSAREGFAKLCKVPIDNVRIISRVEYEDNTEE